MIFWLPPVATILTALILAYDRVSSQIKRVDKISGNTLTPQPNMLGYQENDHRCQTETDFFKHKAEYDKIHAHHRKATSMTSRRVTCTGKDSDGDITSLGNESAWGTVAKATAISHIENETYRYYVSDSNGSSELLTKLPKEFERSSK